MTSISLSVIIVSFNTRELLKDCLASLFRAIREDGLENGTEVIVVDNASSDGSVKMIRNTFKKVRLLINSKNYGFAYANNQGIRVARGPFFLLLNSDTLIPKGTLFNLIKKISSDPKSGAVAPKLLNKDGTIQPSAGFFPTPIRIFFWMFFLDDLPFLSSFIKPYHIDNPKFYLTSSCVGWASGACLMIRKEATDKSGLLDQDIFMYGEEVEWCRRIIHSGFRILFCHEASVTHLKGGSGEGALSGIVQEFEFLKYYFRKKGSVLTYWTVRLMLRSGALLRLVLFGIIGHNKEKKIIYAKAFRMA